MHDSSASTSSYSLHTAVAWTAWPGLLLICLSITGYGFSVDHPALFFNIAYAFLAVCLFTLEQKMPLTDALRYAAACGALSTTRKGASAAAPTKAEVEAFLARI